jgi:hypothetical protein
LLKKMKRKLRVVRKRMRSEKEVWFRLKFSPK